jgi:transposase-like protein
MSRPSRYSKEVRERSVRMVLEHEGEHASQWSAIRSIAEKIGCTPETLRKWVRKAERDVGQDALRLFFRSLVALQDLLAACLLPSRTKYLVSSVHISCLDALPG